MEVLGAKVAQYELLYKAGVAQLLALQKEYLTAKRDKNKKKNVVAVELNCRGLK